jgi:hypothetical protein
MASGTQRAIEVFRRLSTHRANSTGRQDAGDPPALRGIQVKAWRAGELEPDAVLHG